MGAGHFPSFSSSTSWAACCRLCQVWPWPGLHRGGWKVMLSILADASFHQGGLGKGSQDASPHSLCPPSFHIWSHIWLHWDLIMEELGVRANVLAAAKTLTCTDSFSLFPKLVPTPSALGRTEERQCVAFWLQQPTHLAWGMAVGHCCTFPGSPTKKSSGTSSYKWVWTHWIPPLPVTLLLMVHCLYLLFGCGKGE